MKKLLLLVTLLLALPSCAGVTKVIENAIPVITEAQVVLNDASTIVNALKAVETVFFLAHPLPEAQIKVEKVFVSVEHGLNAANLILSGSQKLTQEQFDLAFAEFKVSYDELVRLMKTIGILDGAGRAGTYGASKPIDVPLAMSYRVLGK